jgi:hypothetical protein
MRDGSLLRYLQEAKYLKVFPRRYDVKCPKDGVTSQTLLPCLGISGIFYIFGWLHLPGHGLAQRGRVEDSKGDRYLIDFSSILTIFLYS